MSQILERESIFLAYLKWHYRQGLREFLEVVGNFLWFVAHFFSFNLLLKTLFTPWKRTRLVGFATRFVVLFVGFISCIFVIIFVLCILMIWILAPIVLLGSLLLLATFFAI